MMPLGLAIHPAAHQTHQDIKDKISRSGGESYSIEARPRKKRSCWVFHKFSEAVYGGDNLVSGGIIAQAEYNNVS